ncbi:HdeD family acid-resistance protein [Yoonia sediminilitoris]|uniref:Uncharacterized membrane protein HdeD (DUF308 family) n=1 Tax=Yoonia sediminilitoris TaxID=1286148 RepID=A0A2T6KIT0_9RHOB|nr:DUF308 domain-containing protein [Yoonia sediminilitoris]PUB15571.1 uncharacterized membrane protein HdeD (DUF308 family) [Yoonia sediminilitoris]RCW96180.1 uncharacterized membrane protein HdeD (DUF308 family) [Yoonia sediminilitoris]
MTFNSEPYMDFDQNAVMAKLRKGFFWAGGVMIVLGVAALFVPMFSSLLVEILIGWLLTVSGCVILFGAFSIRGTSPFLWQLLVGLLTLAAGLLLLFFPLEGLLALSALLGILLLVTGVAQARFALWIHPAPGWGWALGSAVISFALGCVILIALPKASTVVLGLMLGIDLASTGTAMIIIGRSIPSEPV